MREIKFRAWDGKVMNENVVIIDNKAYKRGYFANIFSKNAGAGGKIMQYTGLKDKNGKSIYEGDIIDNSYINPMNNKKIEMIYYIEFEGGIYHCKFIGKQKGTGLDRFLWMINIDCEIIGNTHEDKNLIDNE